MERVLKINMEMVEKMTLNFKKLSYAIKLATDIEIVSLNFNEQAYVLNFILAKAYSRDI